MAQENSGSKRGFAAMDPKKQREIASEGGKASGGGNRSESSAQSERGVNNRQSEASRQSRKND